MIRKFILLIVTIAALGFITVVHAANPEYAPNWRVGDCWSVRFNYGPDMRTETFTYAVTSVSTSAIPLATVTVRAWGRETNPYDCKDAETWELVFETRGMTLINIKKKHYKRIEKEENPFGADTWVDYQEGLQCAFPKIPETGTNEYCVLYRPEFEDQDKDPFGGLLDTVKNTVIPGVPVYRDGWVESGQFGTVQTTTFTSNSCDMAVSDGVMSEAGVITQQVYGSTTFVWVRGQKWWHSATYRTGTNVYITAVMFDSDGDFLDDDWEMKYFGNLSQGKDDDPDKDGVSNLDEYLMDTDPTDPHSKPPDLDVVNPLPPVFKPGVQDEHGKVQTILQINGKKYAWVPEKYGRGFSGRPGCWSGSYTASNTDVHVEIDVNITYDCRLKNFLPPPNESRILQTMPVHVPGARKSECMRLIYMCRDQCSTNGWCGASWTLSVMVGTALIDFQLSRFSSDDASRRNSPAFEKPELSAQKIEMLLDLATAFLSFKGAIHHYEIMSVSVAASVNHRPMTVLRPRNDAMLDQATGINPDGVSDYILEAGVNDSLTLDFDVFSTPVSMTVDRQHFYGRQPCPCARIRISEGKRAFYDNSNLVFSWTADDNGKAHLEWGPIYSKTVKAFNVEMPTGSVGSDVKGALFLRPNGIAEKTIDQPPPAAGRDSVWSAVLERFEAAYDTDYEKLFGQGSLSGAVSVQLRRANKLLGDKYLHKIARFLVVPSVDNHNNTLELMTMLDAYRELIPIIKAKTWIEPDLRTAIKYQGNPNGEWYKEEVEKVLLMWLAGKRTKDRELIDEARQDSDKLYSAMVIATNASYRGGQWRVSAKASKAKLTSTVINVDRGKANAWAAMLMCEAFSATRDPRYLDMARRQAQALIQAMSGDSFCFRKSSALAYHALRQTTELSGDDHFKLAADKIRSSMLNAWGAECGDPEWLIDLLRTFDVVYYPYEDESPVSVKAESADAPALPVTQ